MRRTIRPLLNVTVFIAVGQCVFSQNLSSNPLVQEPPSAFNSKEASLAGNSNAQSANPNLANSNRSVRPVSQPSARPAPRSRFSSLSDVPYMIGDTPGGGGGTLQIGGFPGQNPQGDENPGSPSLRIQHPAFGSSRLNIAENNSPVVSDRFYVNYRHFHNASEVGVLSYAPTGGLNSLDINTWTFGLERKLNDTSSLDVRLPINTQLASNLNFAQTTGPVTSFPLNDTDVTVGNLGLILKKALLRTDELYLSGGASLNLPTAPNVTVRTTINDDQFRNFNPANGNPLGTFPYRFSMNTHYSNDTVNLTPFLGAVIRPSTSLYGMSFLQLDVPLNPSRVESSGDSFLNNQPVSTFNLQGRVDQQVLLRANLAAGKWLWQNDQNRFINSMGIQGEMHYTTALNDADFLGPISAAPNLGVGSGVGFGNAFNRIDLLDSVFGIQMVMQKTLITNSFIVPMRSGSNRNYDFEYSLSVNRRF